MYTNTNCPALAHLPPHVGGVPNLSLCRVFLCYAKPLQENQNPHVCRRPSLPSQTRQAATVHTVGSVANRVQSRREMMKTRIERTFCCLGRRVVLVLHPVNGNKPRLTRIKNRFVYTPHAQTEAHLKRMAASLEKPYDTFAPKWLLKNRTFRAQIREWVSGHILMEIGARRRPWLRISHLPFY